MVYSDFEDSNQALKVVWFFDNFEIARISQSLAEGNTRSPCPS